MSKFFEYTDNQGRLQEIESFTVSDFTTVKSPNSPVKLGPDGYLDPSLIDPVRDYGVKAKTEYITLIQENIESKRIILTNIPVSTPTFIPDGALSQRYSIDFVYSESDNSVSWAGLGLDGFLDIGETVEVSYLYK